MALSDQLAKLSARAKEAEEHAAAARDKTKAAVICHGDSCGTWACAPCAPCES